MVHSSALLIDTATPVAQPATSTQASLAADISIKPRPPIAAEGAVLDIALLSDLEIIVHGVSGMLAPHGSRIRVTTAGLHHRGRAPVDLTLIDTSLTAPSGIVAVNEALDDPHAGAVVIFVREGQPVTAETAIAMGCSGCVDQALGSDELVATLERIGGGETVVSPSLVEAADETPTAARVEPWPGHWQGLSRREGETLTMITRGLTNLEIAEHHNISINTVKSYVRSAYRKIGVERRAQAVRWGMKNGLLLVW